MARPKTELVIVELLGAWMPKIDLKEKVKRQGAWGYGRRGRGEL